MCECQIDVDIGSPVETLRESNPKVDDSIMRRAILKVAFWIAVLSGGFLFIVAITGGLGG
jgi:hypothetical protein